MSIEDAPAPCQPLPQRPLALPAPTPPTGIPVAVAALCGLDVEAWTRLALDLLPVGAAWPREPDTTLARFWSAVAEERVRIHARDCALLAEAYPCGADELLPEWERMLGLPNVCTARLTLTAAERRALVCVWLALRGGQSAAYFVWLAAIFGYDATVTEHFPSRVGLASAGCAPLGIRPFWWVVTVYGIPRTIPRAGRTQVGEPPCGPVAALVECLVTLFQPAHTLVTFRYPTP